MLDYSLGGTLAQGTTARLHARGGAVAFLTLLDTQPPETQDWQEKEANGLDPAVLTEVRRERRAFLTVQQGNALKALPNAIEDNYADAVCLLATAHSVPLAGHAAPFVAERTLAPDVSPKRDRLPWISSLDVYRQDCTHVDIISPTTFGLIGPVINALINKPV